MPPILRANSKVNDHATCRVNVYIKDQEDPCASRLKDKELPAPRRAHLRGIPDPFQEWNTSRCGPTPINSSYYRHATGQGTFPSRKCVTCSYGPEGHVLQLPTAPDTLNSTDAELGAFVNSCVAAPLRLWLHHYIDNRTEFILSDMILVDAQEQQIQRFQYGFELLVLRLWWPRSVRHTHSPQPALWEGAAWCCGALALAELVACILETKGGGRFNFPSLMVPSALVQLIMAALWLLFCVEFAISGARWKQLLVDLTKEVSSGDNPSLVVW